jgi:DtxR family Mn-dependent transcriptional regulator
LFKIRGGGKMSGLTQSMENYLRSIYELSYANKGVRLTDLAEKMKVKKASANNAVMKLTKMGYCVQLKYEPIFLTDAGIEAVKAATGKHIIILKFLKDVLSVDNQTAETETTKIEHHLSTSTVYAMHQLHTKLKSKPDN